MNSFTTPQIVQNSILTYAIQVKYVIIIVVVFQTETILTSVFWCVCVNLIMCLCDKCAHLSVYMITDEFKTLTLGSI